MTMFDQGSKKAICVVSLILVYSLSESPKETTVYPSCLGYCKALGILGKATAAAPAAPAALPAASAAAVAWLKEKGRALQSRCVWSHAAIVIVLIATQTLPGVYMSLHNPKLGSWTSSF